MPAWPGWVRGLARWMRQRGCEFQFKFRDEADFDMTLL